MKLKSVQLNNHEVTGYTVDEFVGKNKYVTSIELTADADWWDGVGAGVVIIYAGGEVLRVIPYHSILMYQPL